MHNDKGFTLIEVAIVVLIGGLFLATASAIFLNYTKMVEIRTTKKRLATIDDALQLFLSLNGRYPCVADLSAPIDDAAFGVEIANCTTAPALPGGRDLGGGAVAVRVGAVPVRTLNLPDDFIGDSWAARFTYAVTESLAVSGTYNQDEGGIFVVDSNGNSTITPAGSAHYVIVSHGRNSSGAAPIGGGGALPCTAGNLEEENCNADATFRSSLLLGTADNARLYDDMLSFKAIPAFAERNIPAGAVMAFNLNACPLGWVGFNNEGRTIISAGGVYNVGDTGGEEDWALTEAEAGYSTLSITAVAGGVNVAQVLPGGSVPHENRPPYIALLYCEKS